MGRKSLEQKKTEQELLLERRKDMENALIDVLFDIEADANCLMCYCLFNLKIFEKTELYDMFRKYELENLFDITFDYFIEEGFISKVEYKQEMAGKGSTYYKTNERVIEYMKNNYKKLVDVIEYNNTEYKDGYKLAIEQHTSLEHYNAINKVKKICIKENIKYLDSPEDLKIKIENNRKNIRKTYTNVEADLILCYNRKKIIVEVERGTTGVSDFTSKMDKLNLVTDRVMFICPNTKACNIVKKKVINWEEEYDERYGRGDINKIRDLKIMIISSSSIKDKVGKRLKSYLKELERKDYFIY